MLHSLEEFCRWLFWDEPEEEVKKIYYVAERMKRNACRRTHYDTFLIPKHSGGTRVIHQPDWLMMKMQRGILRLIENTQSSHAATAYQKGSSILLNAQAHVHKEMVLCCDIRDFFASIGFKQVYHAIDHALSQSADVGRHYLNAFDRSSADLPGYNRVLSYYFACFTTLDGCLPMGAPTSPFLSNLVMLPIDNALCSYCEKRGISYTRYSDDMTFSGSFSSQVLLRFVRRLLAEHGFSLNDAKTRLTYRGWRQQVTGLVVNDIPGVPKSYRRQIRQELYYIRRFGLVDHLNRKFAGKPPSPEQYLYSLLGKLAFVGMFHPSSELDRGRELCLSLLHEQKSLPLLANAYKEDGTKKE